MPLPLLEGMSTRKRRPNWTDQECLLLAQLMQERREVIRGSCSTGVSVQEKRRAWEEITHAVNTAFPHMMRTVSDCNKKWENMLAKSREEIKRHKRQAGGDDGLSLQQFSAVTQIVISVMNMSEKLQQNREEAELCYEPCGKTAPTEDKPSLADLRLQCYTTSQTSPSKPHAEPSACPTLLSPLARSPGIPFNGVSAAERLDGSCSASPVSMQGATLQERMELEMSVLRRQEAVLKLQEEYYTLKIQAMKKQMGETGVKD